VGEVCPEAFAGSFECTAVFPKHHDGIASGNEFFGHGSKSVPLPAQTHEDSGQHRVRAVVSAAVGETFGFCPRNICVQKAKH
jgi:hypothetical protein